MTSNDIAEAHRRAVSMVDFLAQRQGATTGRGVSRAWEIALAKAEELEYWTGRAKKSDWAEDKELRIAIDGIKALTDPANFAPIYDEQETP